MTALFVREPDVVCVLVPLVGDVGIVGHWGVAMNRPARLVPALEAVDSDGAKLDLIPFGQGVHNGTQDGCSVVTVDWYSQPTRGHFATRAAAGDPVPSLRGQYIEIDAPAWVMPA
jgi:hypothetical protein